MGTGHGPALTCCSNNPNVLQGALRFSDVGAARNGCRDLRSSISELDMTASNLTGNYGSTSGIRLVPNGWDVEAGQTYSVSVTGIDSPIDDEVQSSIVISPSARKLPHRPGPATTGPIAH